jgi:hypothetical protein
LETKTPNLQLLKEATLNLVIGDVVVFLYGNR